jgi:pyrimidine-specific ribonucleoside hydrolase
MRPAEPVHVIVDAGVDDALALAVLTGLDIALEQVVASTGSLDLMTTASVTSRFLATVRNDALVTLGASSGLTAPYPDGRDPFHGADGFGGFADSLDSAPTPSQHFMPLNGPVLATAALTVVAAAIQRGDSVTQVTWMGGSVVHGGNMTAAAEFNAWMDPVAADLVLTSGVPVAMVPLDVTMRCAWTMKDVETLATRGEAGPLLASAIGAICSRDGTFVPHDAVAVIAMVDPDLFGWTRRYVRCETQGALTTGQTVVDRRPQSPEPNAAVADDVDVGAVRDRILDAVSQVALCSG